MSAAATAVRERPILFRAEMVRAILEGRKTQTRRPVKDEVSSDCVSWVLSKSLRWVQQFLWNGQVWQKAWSHRCPYGKPGDRLWVREMWGIGYETGTLIDPCLNYQADGSQAPILHHKDSMQPLWYVKGRPGPDSEWLVQVRDGWRPSIFMPRWASRITLEITDVRVQRVQEISEEDAQAEGIERMDLSPRTLNGHHVHPFTSSYAEAFRALWNTIHGGTEHAWERNPWVWALTFRRLS